MTLIIIGAICWFCGLVAFVGGGAWTASAPRYKPSTGGLIAVILGWLLAVGGAVVFVLGICFEIFS